MTQLPPNDNHSFERLGEEQHNFPESDSQALYLTGHISNKENGGMGDLGSLTARAKTALNLEVAGKTDQEIGTREQDLQGIHLDRRTNNRNNSGNHGEVSLESSIAEASLDGQDNRQHEDPQDTRESLHPYDTANENELLEMLYQFVRGNLIGKNSKDVSQDFLGRCSIEELDLGGFENCRTTRENMKQYILIARNEDEKLFHSKLKHFLIFSLAGKPIYSLCGTDNLVAGYMGLITTILSTFEENWNEEIKEILYGPSLKIAISKRYPFIFVAITKVKYEILISSTTLKSILSLQLDYLHAYILALLSKPSVLKNFHNRMNYDYRKVLSLTDFYNLDDLSMQLTYGLLCGGADHELIGNSDNLNLFMSNLLDSSLQCAKIYNKLRTKLNSILLSARKIIVDSELQEQNASDSSSIFNFSSSNTKKESYLGDYLLFAFFSVGRKILSSMRPKNHALSNRDVNILFSVLANASPPLEIQKFEDSWIPICMPDFNPNGFLYAFVKRFYPKNFSPAECQSTSPLTLILLSSTKNGFFHMQQIAQYLIDNISASRSLTKGLSETLNSSFGSLKNELANSGVKHFILKHKKYKQFTMSEVKGVKEDNRCIESDLVLKLAYFYSLLCNNRTTGVKELSPELRETSFSDRKLSFMRWNFLEGSIIGLLLSDENYDFYCLCEQNLSSKDIINETMRIIRWCQRWEKRLFVGEGLVY